MDNRGQAGIIALFGIIILIIGVFGAVLAFKEPIKQLMPFLPFEVFGTRDYIRVIDVGALSGTKSLEVVDSPATIGWGLEEPKNLVPEKSNIAENHIVYEVQSTKTIEFKASGALKLYLVSDAQDHTPFFSGIGSYCPTQPCTIKIVPNNSLKNFKIYANGEPMDVIPSGQATGDTGIDVYYKWIIFASSAGTSGKIDDLKVYNPDGSGMLIQDFESDAVGQVCGTRLIDPTQPCVSISDLKPVAIGTLPSTPPIVTEQPPAILQPPETPTSPTNPPIVPPATQPTFLDGLLAILTTFFYIPIIIGIIILVAAFYAGAG